MSLFSKPKPASETAEEIRGVSDEDLKWISNSTVMLLAMARLFEAQGIDDQPLIDELYKRGRAERPMKKTISPPPRADPQAPA